MHKSSPQFPAFEPLTDGRFTDRDAVQRESVESRVPYWLHFGELLLRDEDTLTADERACLVYVKADNDVLHGYGGTDPRRWCYMSRKIRTLVCDLGRMPESGDAGYVPAMQNWVESLRYSELNPFQRAALEHADGWVWPEGSRAN